MSLDAADRGWKHFCAVIKYKEERFEAFELLVWLISASAGSVLWQTFLTLSKSPDLTRVKLTLGCL